MRWVSAVLCVLFLTAVTLQLASVAGPAAADGQVHAGLASSSADEPCSGDHPAGQGEHCHVSSACPMCGPSDTAAIAFPRPAVTFPAAMTYTFLPGDHADPQLRPPQA